MERLATFDQLATFVWTSNLDATVRDADREIDIRGPFPAPMLVRWQVDRPFIQLIQPMLKDLLGDRLSDLETAILRTNLELEVPVFELSHRMRVLHARIAIAAFPHEGVHPLTFEAQRAGCLRFALAYLPVFQQIVGGAPGHTVGAIAQRLQSEK